MSHTETVIFRMTDWSRDKILELQSENAKLKDENRTFRNASKACEDCDAFTMGEHRQLKEMLERMAEALKFFSDTNNYVYATGMSPADKTPKVLRDGKTISKSALTEYRKWKEGKL